jgi:copper chaperone
MKTQLQINGMSCQHCVKAVDGALRELSGIKVEKVNVGNATISSEGPIDLEKVREAIEELGFELA